METRRRASNGCSCNSSKTEANPEVEPGFVFVVFAILTPFRNGVYVSVSARVCDAFNCNQTIEISRSSGSCVLCCKSFMPRDAAAIVHFIVLSITLYPRTKSERIIFPVAGRTPRQIQISLPCIVSECVCCLYQVGLSECTIHFVQKQQQKQKLPCAAPKHIRRLCRLMCAPLLSMILMTCVRNNSSLSHTLSQSHTHDYYDIRIALCAL